MLRSSASRKMGIDKLDLTRRIVPMVEQWSPKPKVKGSNPFSPVYKTELSGDKNAA